MLDLRNYKLKIPKRFKKHLNFLKSKYGRAFTVDTWSDGMVKTKEIKRAISIQLHTYQKFRCVYCEKRLINETKEIDHIAPKHLNPEYTFTPINLAYSCGLCNSSSKKGQKPIITGINSNYSNQDFYIVHPYLDDFRSEIVYQDSDGIYLDLPNCSKKGLNTIEMFDFDSLEMIMFRAGRLISERNNPISDRDLKELIQKAVSYK